MKDDTKKKFSALEISNMTMHNIFMEHSKEIDRLYEKDDTRAIVLTSVYDTVCDMHDFLMALMEEAKE